jgi:hypothetical protein
MDEFKFSLTALFSRQTMIFSMARASMRGNALIYGPCRLYLVSLRAGALKPANATPN